MELEHVAQDVVIERKEVLQLTLAESVARGSDVAERMGGLKVREEYWVGVSVIVGSCRSWPRQCCVVFLGS